MKDDVTEFKIQHASPEHAVPWLLTYVGVAVSLGISARRVGCYVSEGHLKAIRLGDRKRRIRLEDLDEFIERTAKRSQVQTTGRRSLDWPAAPYQSWPIPGPWPSTEANSEAQRHLFGGQRRLTNRLLSLFRQTLYR